MSRRRDRLAQDVAMDGAWEQSRGAHAKLAWLHKVRPQVLAAMLADLFAGKDRRRWVTTPQGEKLFLDPLSFTGHKLLGAGVLEPDTRRIFEARIKPGFVVLDVGANEGYFSVMAGKLAGPDGFVVSVEPQTRLIETLRANLHANGIAHSIVIEAALGALDGTAELFLATGMNTGASGLVRKFQWSRRSEPARVITPESLVEETGYSQFDFVKVDVEGYEPEVVEGLLPLLREGRVGALLIDFHKVILDRRGISADSLHATITGAGMELSERGKGDFRLYLPMARQA